MNYWMDTVETIPGGQGIALFGAQHLVWLGAIVLFLVGCCWLYRRLNQAQRKIMRFVCVALLVADEIFKMAVLFAGGRWIPQYLPLHLCSINIFVISYHSFRPSKGLDNFLYTVCIPAAIAALLFPNWAKLPMENFMSIHSFTVHSLLIVYPLMLFVGGDIRPNVRYIGRCMLILVGLAAVGLVANLIFGTNFMFLMEAEEGNPLKWFGDNWGSHLLGFPVLIAGVLLVMHVPLHLIQRYIQRKER